MATRILHVWNTAGVASVIAKFTDREYRTQSRVIARRDMDRVGLTTYGTTYPDGPVRFFLRALWMARDADIVHVHSLDRIVPWVKRLTRKPVVMHYHGTDIERRWEEKEARWSRADYVAVSTPNLLEGGPGSAVFIPNPVDTDIFRPARESVPRSAASFHYGMDTEAEEAARRLGLNLTWFDRWTVPHSEMPGMLTRFEYFIDMRRPPGHIQARSVGRAALEALACGCKVVDWTGNVLMGLPPENHPAAVASRWNEAYINLLAQQRAGSGKPRPASPPSPPS